jgi:predicted anti-sigma-YlaC factor YlaD
VEHLGTGRLFDAAASVPALTLPEAHHLRSCDECRDLFAKFLRQFVATEQVRKWRTAAKRLVAPSRRSGPRNRGGYGPFN